MTQLPPSDATVRFDGTDLGRGKVTTVAIGGCQLHIEWATPDEVSGDGQGRGNSGVFPMDRHEIQVLDRCENPTYADGYAGAVYGQQPPLVNARREPGEPQGTTSSGEGRGSTGTRSNASPS